jgi:hypothetical protein
MWVHQTHIRKIRPMKLSDTSNQGIKQFSHLDYIKGGTPNTEIW